MRWSKILLLLALVGCTSSELSQLHDLQQQAKRCGGIGALCGEATVDVAGIVACMNDARASGTLAEADWTDDATNLDYYIFTDGDHLRVFTEDYASSGDSEVREDKTCAGPLETTTTAACGALLQLKIDGC
jgi:hypothetical protein